MIRVLIVDDSPVGSQLLSYLLSGDPDVCVLGVAGNGEEAIAMTRRLKPDLVTMDIVMPGMNGFEATRSIMENTPVPIVIVSSLYDPKEVALSFKAVAAGALAILAKPVGIGHPLHARQSRDFVDTIKTLADVKVVTRRGGTHPVGAGGAAAAAGNSRDLRMIVIGASTGGPPVLQGILSLLPKEFPVPIAIVQHIAAGFTEGFAAWLAETTGCQVRIPEQGEQYRAGRVYLAPDNLHLGFDHGCGVVLDDSPADGLQKPSIAHLFASAAEVFREKTVGVLLTGMGRDGADALKKLREAGAVTIAQDRESSVVFGMNGEAVRLGAATYQLPPDGIARLLISLTAHLKS